MNIYELTNHMVPFVTKHNYIVKYSSDDLMTLTTPLKALLA